MKCTSALHQSARDFYSIICYWTLLTPSSFQPQLLGVDPVYQVFTNQPDPWSGLNIWSPFYWRGLTHWGRVTHICVSKLTIIGSDNGLPPGGRQAIIWTNDGILLIRTFRTHFSEIVSEIHTFSFKKMHFKMSSGKWRPSCLGLNVLTLIPAWISNHMNCNVWEITYPFPNFNGTPLKFRNG